MDDTIYFAKTNFRDENRTFGIKNNDRRQHFYIIGKSGTGKTSLLANMALQDIQNGKGLAIIDPHGDFVEEVAERIPESRANDTIYFNPSDTDYPIGFNVLEVPDPKYKHLVASDLMGIFTKIWANVWSARMEYILTNCILALLDTPGTTLLGIPRILVDQNYRRKIIENVKDPVVKAFWTHEFDVWRDQFRNEAIVPIQNKVGQFLSTSLIRNIVGQQKSSLNISDIMNSGKILLVNVSKGRVGEDNAGLLGAMLITKIQLAAMERVRIAEKERKDFYLYVDEFQNFVTDSFASILSEARKYRLNLIVAHQYIGQLISGTSTKVRDAIFGNVGTMLAFRVGAADAEFLEKEFEPEFVIQDLVNLPNFNIYLKLMVNGITSRPFSGATLPPLSTEEESAEKARIIEVSRKLYGSPRGEVEERINKWSETGGEFSDEEAQKNAEKNLAVCWTCGKEIELKFKPDKERAVYCRDCLKKIENKELSPINLPKFKKEKTKMFEPSLGTLGIEFEESHPQKNNFKNKEEKDGAPKSFSAAESAKTGNFVLRNENWRDKKQTISLSDLKQIREKSRGENPVKKRVEALSREDSKETSELKKVLKEALAKAIKQNEEPPKNSENSESAKNDKKTDKNENKKISPGETIKF